MWPNHTGDCDTSHAITCIATFYQNFAFYIWHPKASSLDATNCSKLRKKTPSVPNSPQQSSSKVKKSFSFFFSRQFNHGGKIKSCFGLGAERKISSHYLKVVNTLWLRSPKATRAFWPLLDFIFKCNILLWRKALFLCTEQRDTDQNKGRYVQLRICVFG
jgi:hypothetical protein